MIQVVEVEGLALERAGRDLFEGLSVRLQAGEALAVTGPNGSGKTSLLRAVAGLLRPAAGTIRFSGPDGALDLAEARARHLHWLGAADGLKVTRTAEAELRFWSEWAGPSGGASRPHTLAVDLENNARPRTRGALDAMGLLPEADTDVRRLSTGQRRRLALARLLASPRALWLLDEPLAPLDATWRTRVGDLMAAHLASGGLVIAAVHDPLPVPARELRLEVA